MKERLKRTGKKYNYEEGLNYSINLINRFVYTKRKLEEKLIKKNISKVDIDKIINYLSIHNLINDNEIGKDYVDQLLNKEKGQNYIKNKLFNKGFDNQLINQLINSVDETILLNNLESKINKLSFKYKDDKNMKSKIIKNCLLSGYYLNDINKIINKLIKDSKIKIVKEDNYDIY